MRVLFWAVFCATYLSASAELTITAELKGEKLPIVATDGVNVFVQREGEKLPAPAKAVWTIEGDLRAEQDQICWSPNYSVWRAVPGVDVKRNEKGLYVAFMWIRQTAYLKGVTFHQPENYWPDLPGEAAVLFSGWLLNGQIKYVQATPIRSRSRALAFDAQRRIRLLPDERDGQAIVLLWQRGHLVSPRPHFADEKVNRAWHAVMRDDPTDLKPLFTTEMLKARSFTNWSLLHYAAEAGSVQTAQLLIDADKTLIIGDKDAGSPLSIAASSGRIEMIKMLLAAGALKDAVDSAGMTPLHHAARLGHVDVITALLDAHAKVSVLSDAHETALAVAINHGQADAAAALQRRGGGFDIGIKRPDFPTLHNPFEDVRVRRMLVTRACKNDLDTVAWLLSVGTTADSTELGVTALFAAAEDAEGDVASVLIRGGAKPNWADANGTTALMRAVAFGNTGYARALLNGGAKANAVDKAGRSALHWAAGRGQTKAVALLLEREANLSLLDGDGYSALDRAILGGAAPSAEILFTRGARVDLKSRQAGAVLEGVIALDQVALLSKAVEDGWPLALFDGKGWTVQQAAQLSKASQCLPVIERAAPRAEKSPSIVSPKQLDTPLKTFAAVSPEILRRTGKREKAKRVLASCVVDTEGLPRFPRIVGSADPDLTSAVLAAFRGWRFSIPQKAGQPVATTIVVPFDFYPGQGEELSMAVVDEPPVSINRELPVYPDRRQEATVTAIFTVTPKGDVCAVEIEGASSPDFAQASKDAVEKWKYTPAMLEGKPVSVRTAVPLFFGLRDK